MCKRCPSESTRANRETLFGLEEMSQCHGQDAVGEDQGLGSVAFATQALRSGRIADSGLERKRPNRDAGRKTGGWRLREALGHDALQRVHVFERMLKKQLSAEPRKEPDRSTMESGTAGGGRVGVIPGDRPVWRVGAAGHANTGKCSHNQFSERHVRPMIGKEQGGGESVAGEKAFRGVSWRRRRRTHSLQRACPRFSRTKSAQRTTTCRKVWGWRAVMRAMRLVLAADRTHSLGCFLVGRWRCARRLPRSCVCAQVALDRTLHAQAA